MTAAYDGGAVTRPHVWLAIAHRPLLTAGTNSSPSKTAAKLEGDR